MAVDKYGKQYCVNNLVMMIVETILKANPDMNSDIVLDEFTKSKTYGLLCDFDTDLWMEGPDYIIELWEEERKI